MSDITPPKGQEGLLRRRGLIATGVGYWLVSAGSVIVASSDVGGLSMGWWRAWIGALVLILAVGQRRELSWALFKPTIIPGLCFGFATSFFFWANQITSVVNASLILALQPLMMVVLAGVVFGEVLTGKDYGWGAVALGGAGALAFAGDSSGVGDIRGDALALISISVGAGYFAVAKIVLKKLDVLPFMAGVFTWAAVSMTPIMLVSGQQIIPGSSGDWVRVGGIAVLPGLGHLFLSYAQGKAPFKMMGLIQLFMPVSSSLLALWFLGQPVSSKQALAMGVVIFSLAALTFMREEDTNTSSSST